MNLYEIYYRLIDLCKTSYIKTKYNPTLLPITFISLVHKKYINVANKITNSIHLIEDFCLYKNSLWQSSSECILSNI